MVCCKQVGALAALLWCSINQTATHTTACIELMLDYITKMEGPSIITGLDWWTELVD